MMLQRQPEKLKYDFKQSSFNVILYDINARKMVSYDVIPYLESEYKDLKGRKKELKTFDDLKTFVKRWSMYQFWSRCEYEIILSDWPPSGKVSEKWDVYRQIEMNLDFVTLALANKIKFKEKKEVKRRKQSIKKENKDVDSSK